MSGEWKGIIVRHSDGRTGQIVEDYIGFGHRALHIRVDDGGAAYVQLNTNGRDTGEAGWEWWCEKFDGGAKFLPLTDHLDTVLSK